jgi:hypothetical protein
MAVGRSGSFTRLRIVFLVAAVLALVAAMVAIGFGAANLASLSGELPVDDPTPAEVSVWNTGWALLWGSLAATIVAGTALSIAALTFESDRVLLSSAAFVVCFALVALVAIGVWFIVLPDVS